MHYSDYHQHPVNKAIHVAMIPMVGMTVVAHMPFNIFATLQVLLVGAYLANYGGLVAVGMYQYFEVIRQLAGLWKLMYPHRWYRDTITVFIFSWIMLFMGHFIEGNRPALTDAPIDAIFHAPLHTSWGLFYDLE